MKTVALARLADETRCPVCFGILKQTVTSTVCLHRFCASCIERCLAGRPPQHKDCPVCRANLHSRRALRPDLNFDRLLRALYGDVVLYGQEEDALVAARNAEVAAAHAQAQAQAEAGNAAAQQRARRAQCEAHTAAAAEGRPNPHRRASPQHQPGGGPEGGAGGVPLSHTARHPGRNGTSRAGTGVGVPTMKTSAAATTAAPKRLREAAAAGRDAYVMAGEVPVERLPAAAPGGAKRQHLMEAEAAWTGAEAACPCPRTELGSPSCGVTRMAEDGEEVAAAPSPPPPAHHHRHLRPRPQAAATAAAAAAGCGGLEAASPRAVAAAGSKAVPPRQGASTAAAAVQRAGCGPGSAASAAAGPGGPLAVPTARSAAELSFRHPGMVVLRLQPGPPTGEGAGAAAGGLGVEGPTSASGRPLRTAAAAAVLPPPLEKPFLLCPAKWTVAHVAQLLSQWLPGARAAGSGPAAPVPPSAIRLEVAPGEGEGSSRPRGPHSAGAHHHHRDRCLRGCTALGSLMGLAVATAGEHCGNGGGRRGGAAASDHSVPLVLLYSVSQPSSSPT